MNAIEILGHLRIIERENESSADRARFVIRKQVRNAIRLIERAEGLPLTEWHRGEMQMPRRVRNNGPEYRAQWHEQMLRRAKPWFRREPQTIFAATPLDELAGAARNKPMSTETPELTQGTHDLIVLAAACAHEANRLYCLTIGDNSQPTWEESEAWQSESAFKGALQIWNDPGGTTPEKSHESWMAEKIDTGWVYGETKDPVAKTHPCLVCYDELPPEQRRKDEIFGGVVRAILMLPPAGYQLIAIVD